jgi:hypothetical protein
MLQPQLRDALVVEKFSGLIVKVKRTGKMKKWSY